MTENKNETLRRSKMDRHCGNCGNCRGWDDQGWGVGEYICALDDTPEGCPEIDENDECPGWIPMEVKE